MTARRRRASAEDRGSRWLADRARLDAHIAALVEAAPNLTVEQTDRLRELLTPVLRPEAEDRS